MCMKEMFAILLCGLVVGCGVRKEVEQPSTAASVADAAGAVCAIATNKVPIATGFFVSYKSTLDVTNRYYLVTAGHVGRKLNGSMVQMMVASKDRKSSIAELCVSPWKYHETADVCVAEITPEYERLTRADVDLHCIDLVFDPTNRLSRGTAKCSVAGIGILHRGVMHDYGVELGSSCVMLGTSVEISDCLASAGELPLVCRSGRIANIPKGLSYPYRDKRLKLTYLFATDIPVVKGMSGAPVFVKGCSSGEEKYWYLAGVTVSIVPSRDEQRLLCDNFGVWKEEHGYVTDVRARAYYYHGNSFLSHVVPFDAVQECIDAIAPGVPLNGILY